MSDPARPTAIYPDLAGKVVFISGGATGIGEELTEAYARQGAVTCFVDIAEKEGEALEARPQRDQRFGEEQCDKRAGHTEQCVQQQRFDMVQPIS